MGTTSTRKKIQMELQRIPDDLLGDLYEYMKYLQYKMRNKSSTEETAPVETAYASEAVLGKDWNSSEEDEAWQDL